MEPNGEYTPANVHLLLHPRNVLSYSYSQVRTGSPPCDSCGESCFALPQDVWQWYCAVCTSSLPLAPSIYPPSSTPTGRRLPPALVSLSPTEYSIREYCISMWESLPSGFLTSPFAWHRLITQSQPEEGTTEAVRWPKLVFMQRLLALLGPSTSCSYVFATPTIFEHLISGTPLLQFTIY